MDTLFIIVVLLALGAIFYFFVLKKKSENSMDVVQDASNEEATIISDFEETTPSEIVVDETLEDVLNEPVSTTPVATEENKNV